MISRKEALILDLLVAKTERDGLRGMPRRLYSPTAAGKRVLKAWTSVARYLEPEFAR